MSDEPPSYESIFESRVSNVNEVISLEDERKKKIRIDMHKKYDKKLIADFQSLLNKIDKEPLKPHYVRTKPFDLKFLREITVIKQQCKDLRRKQYRFDYKRFKHGSYGAFDYRIGDNIPTIYLIVPSKDVYEIYARTSCVIL